MDWINWNLLKNPGNWIFFGLALFIMLMIGHTFFKAQTTAIEGNI